MEDREGGGIYRERYQWGRGGEKPLRLGRETMEGRNVAGGP